MPQVGVGPGAVVGVAAGAVVGGAPGAVVGVAAGAVVGVTPPPGVGAVGAVATLAPAGKVTAGDVVTDETVKDNWAPEAAMVRDDRY